MKIWTRLNSGQIRSATLELLALERLKNVVNPIAHSFLIKLADKQARSKILEEFEF